MDRVLAVGKGYSNPDYEMHSTPQHSNYQEVKGPYQNEYAIPNKMDEEESEEEEDSPYGDSNNSETKRILFHALRLILTLLFVGVLLGIPLLVTMQVAMDDDIDVLDNTSQNKNFVFWLFVWLESVWVVGWCTHVFMTLFPYIFYGLMKWINPAHRRYWRVFRPLKGPIVCLVTILIGWGLLAVIIMYNDEVAYSIIARAQIAIATSTPTAAATTTTQAVSAAATTDETLPGIIPRRLVPRQNPGNSNSTVSLDEISDRTFYFQVIQVIFQIMMMLVFWAMMYLVEKIVIVYISVHYHYRSDHGRIERSKNLINALARLYNISLKLDPLYCDKFQDQDIIIRDAVAAAKRNKRGSLKFFQKIGGASSKVLGAFGSMLGSGKDSHWFRSGNSYAIVEHALERPASAAALAQRIWISLTPYGKDGLTTKNIADALGMDGKEEAEKIMKALDENENGDVRLTELEPMLVEAGKTRLNVYRNIQEIDHAINTLDWILLIFIGLFMTLLILLGYVDFLKDFKSIFGLIALGVSAAAGRVATDFFMGCVFILFKHPFDIGDRVDIYNAGEKVHTGMILKRVSLLYCVFERTDIGAVVQYPNARLSEKRIDNHTRSGLATEKLCFCVNIKTSFKDLEKIQNEMKAFLSSPENNRDYQAKCSIRVKDIHDFEKMEIAMLITHKANWSIDGLKAARSSRLYCKLIEIARTVPIKNVLENGPLIGGEGKPSYMVVVSEEEANAKRREIMERELAKRYDWDTVKNAGMDAEARKAQDEKLKEAEAKAAKVISSIPATMAGRLADRPAGKPSKNLPAQATSVQIYDQVPQQRVHARSFSSESPLYHDDSQYQGAGAGFQQQSYEPRRTGNNGLSISSRQNRF